MVKIEPILIPYEVKSVEDIKGGVGTPNLIHDIKRNVYWLLFTGWRDPRGRLREVFVVEVDKSLALQWNTLKKILRYDFPVSAPYTHNTVRGFYNATKDEFIITTSHGSKILLYTFDNEWNLKKYKEIIDLGSVRDFGFPVKPVGVYTKYRDAIAVTRNSERKEELEIYTVKNIDNIDEVTTENLGVIARWGSNDVMDFTLLPRFQIFAEQNSCSKWTLHTFVGPTLDEIPSDEFFGKFIIMQTPITHLLEIDDNIVQLGHPHYTVLPDGVPKLLVVAFRDTWSLRSDTGRWGYTHEIWSVYLDKNLFDPKLYYSFKLKIFPRDMNKYIYVPYAKKLTVYSGLPLDRIKLYEAQLPGEDFIINPLKKDGKLIIEDPSQWIKLEVPKDYSEVLEKPLYLCASI
ncbi:MAG: hypothetical protein QW775_02410 [Ignisphaera sp.]|uniref:Uncharacterized protein n=1 Tax=Ignisphaera aggregans TaxID=334771 RepID=A0A7C4JKR6_9CREN